MGASAGFWGAATSLWFGAQRMLNCGSKPLGAELTLIQSTGNSLGPIAAAHQIRAHRMEPRQQEGSKVNEELMSCNNFGSDNDFALDFTSVLRSLLFVPRE